MTSLSVSGVATSYAYRADGMRVKKTKGADVTRSYYDGQMPVEEDSVVTGTSSVTRNFVGARGIESIFTTTTSGTTTAFPLYDCHGNMVATIARSGPGFTTSNVRTYDVWGGVRTGASTGGPKGRYVANLGHVQDDESGLIYMRARYYESESGRFISEDPAMDGENWYSYCANEPINRFDPSGKTYIEIDGWFFRLDKVGNNPTTLADFAFGKDRGCSMGSYRINGTLKHDYGHRVPDEILRKLGQNKKFRNWLRVGVNSRAGQNLLSPGAARDSVTATFNYDPFFVIGLFVILGIAGFGGESDEMWSFL